MYGIVPYKSFQAKGTYVPRKEKIRFFFTFVGVIAESESVSYL
jgi:hypothetical protein